MTPRAPRRVAGMVREPEQMEAGELARYIAERISLSNYDEARRATRMLVARLDAAPTLSEDTADAIVKAHVAGQEVGEQRMSGALRELVRVCIAMDAALQDSRCEESECRAAMHGAADALGEPLPAALLATWGEQ